MSIDKTNKTWVKCLIITYTECGLCYPSNYVRWIQLFFSPSMQNVLPLPKLILVILLLSCKVALSCNATNVVQYDIYRCSNSCLRAFGEVHSRQNTRKVPPLVPVSDHLVKSKTWDLFQVLITELKLTVSI